MTEPSPVCGIGGRPRSGLAGNESISEDSAFTSTLESSCLTSEGGWAVSFSERVLSSASVLRGPGDSRLGSTAISTFCEGGMTPQLQPSCLISMPTSLKSVIARFTSSFLALVPEPCAMKLPSFLADRWLFRPRPCCCWPALNERLLLWSRFPRLLCRCWLRKLPPPWFPPRLFLRFWLFGKFPRLFCWPGGRFLFVVIDPDLLARPRLLFCIPPWLCAFKGCWIGGREGM